MEQKSNRGGFVPIVIVLIVAIVIAVGAYAFITQDPFIAKILSSIEFISPRITQPTSTPLI